MIGPVSTGDGQQLLESTMRAVIVRYVFKPNPGADMLALLEMVKEGAAIWRKTMRR
jgi:hypothetical protein